MLDWGFFTQCSNLPQQWKDSEDQSLITLSAKLPKKTFGKIAMNKMNNNWSFIIQILDNPKSEIPEPNSIRGYYIIPFA
jgi:hypothetical protein